MTDAADTLMFVEAATAPATVARQLDANRAVLAEVGARLRAAPPAVVMTVARGSSDHAATYLKHLVETRLGIPVASAAPSVASLHGMRLGRPDMLAVGISQSGASPDLLATMRAAIAGGAASLALVNVEEAPLAALSDIVLPLHAGPERSVAATKSYVGALAGGAALVAAWSDDRALSSALTALPAQLAAAWAVDWTPLVDALADRRGLYVIGRGAGFGAAQEAALKLKETCGLHAEAFSAAEVRHGPMALVGPDLPLLVFRQDDATMAGTDALVADALAAGATVLVAGSGPPVPGAVHLPLPSTEPTLAPIVAVQAFYRAAATLALRRGFDPDHPRALRKVTETV